LAVGRSRITCRSTCFDFGKKISEAASEPDDRAFRFNTRKCDPPVSWLPLFTLFDPKRLFAHQKRLLEVARSSDKGNQRLIEPTKGLAKRDTPAQTLADRAEALAERFKDYQIPVVPLVSEDLSLVTESFVRVNSEGKRMRETNMVRALSYSPGRDIERELEALKAEFAPYGWGNIDDQLLLNVLKAHWRLNVLDTQPRKLFEQIKEDGYEKTLETLKQSVGWAIERLAAMGVRGPCALPYANQLIALADAAWQLQQPKLETPQTERLHTWFWATTYGEYFTAMSGRRIRDAIDYLHGIVTKGRDPLPPDLVREVSPIRGFNFRATRTKALMLLTTTRIDDIDLRFRTQSQLGVAGNEAVQKLFPAADSTRAENRVVALPQELEALRLNLNCRQTLFEQLEEISPESRRHLLARYMLPEDAPHLDLSRATGEIEAVLESRRANMDALEREFLAGLGLVLRKSDDEI
jgi:hypothetical protein